MTPDAYPAKPNPVSPPALPDYHQPLQVPAPHPEAISSLISQSECFSGDSGEPPVMATPVRSSQCASHALPHPATAQRVLIAIGGNALHEAGSNQTVSQQHLTTICQKLVSIIQQGYRPLITFGNGPQVGMLYDMAETAPKMLETHTPLDVCVSWTQGEIGYRLLSTLNQHLHQAGITDLCVMAVNTTVVVDPNDPAFQNPTKPIGQFISPEEAQQLYETHGWIIGPDANRGYRRMVPSPKPQAILEEAALKHLVQQENTILLCGGGGGVPVYWQEGQLHGIEAVIDKDYTSCLLAQVLEIPALVICTGVENVYLNFGTPEQTALEKITLAEARQYQAEGHFAAGSMGPKMGALMDYVAHGGQRALMTSLEALEQAIQGQAGTEIYPDAG